MTTHDLSGPLLQVNDLCIEFHTERGITRAVDHISFSLQPGETLGIVGESGSGKSVTALAVMQLLQSPPSVMTSGSILFQQHSAPAVNLAKLDELSMRKYRGKDLAMIFQEPMTSLNPVMRCGKQVMESLVLHDKLADKAAKARTLELFNEVSLPEAGRIFTSYPHELSGGMRQRVMIAMAMACNPEILICDEPTTALDVTIQKNILDLLRKLQEKHKMGIIFITHDLGVISQIADRVAVMQHGRIVESGPIGQVFRRPVHIYTKGLLACRPPLDVRPKKLTVVDDFGNPESTDKPAFWTTAERKEHLDKLYSQPPVLQVKNIGVRFPEKRNFFGKTLVWKTAVDHISFDVYPGETLGLVGESGCGKTTLGRAILRLVESTSGQIIYKGRDLGTLPLQELRHFRKNLQIIFQDPYSSLNPRMTAGESITEPMRVHHLFENNKKRYQRAVELMTRVGLEESHFFRYPHEFSGGQRQRICIARALALNPEFIICDESVSALDISHQAQVLNLLNDLRKEFGFTCIFISHDLSVVKFMSDRIVVMKQGKIEELGEADEIYTHPHSGYTRTLIDALPKLNY